MDKQFQDALLAIKSGKYEEAQLLLGELIQHDPQNTHAWFLLSTVSSSEQQKISFLQKVLTLNPTHHLALAQLAQLQNKEPEPRIVPTAEPITPVHHQPTSDAPPPISRPTTPDETDFDTSDFTMPDPYADINLTDEATIMEEPMAEMAHMTDFATPPPPIKSVTPPPPPPNDPLAAARALAKKQTVDTPTIDKVALPPSPGSAPPTTVPNKWLLPVLILLTIIVGILFYLVS